MYLVVPISNYFLFSSTFMFYQFVITFFVKGCHRTIVTKLQIDRWHEIKLEIICDSKKIVIYFIFPYKRAYVLCALTLVL